MKKKSSQPQAKTTGSKTESNSGNNPTLKEPGVQTPTGEGNAIPNQHAHSTEVTLQSALAAPSWPFTKSDFSKKCIEIAAAKVQPNVIVASEPVGSAPDPTRANYWADRINENVRRSMKQLLEAGNNLVAAKAKLKPREWLKLFDQKLIPFHLREAQRLMQVAQHPILSNANNCSLLPPTPQALSALSQAESKALEQALISGQINPRTTIADAKLFRREHPAPGAKIKPVGPQKEFDLNRSLKHCHTVLWDEMGKCPDHQLGGLADGIQDMATQILAAASDVQEAHPSNSIEPSVLAVNGTLTPPKA